MFANWPPASSIELPAQIGSGADASKPRYSTTYSPSHWYQCASTDSGGNSASPFSEDPVRTPTIGVADTGVASVAAVVVAGAAVVLVGAVVVVVVLVVVVVV